MVTRTDRFITRMKLRELRDQRLRLLSVYDELSRSLARAAPESERLRLLYDGLRRIQFASRPLHPEVANLDPLLLEIASGRPSAETVAFWRSRLERELGQGRLRAELVYIFGALLEQLAQTASDAEQDADAERVPDERRAELIALMTGEPASPPPTSGQTSAGLDALFADFSYTRATSHVALQAQAERHGLLGRVNTKELSIVLQRIVDNPHRAATTRAQARVFLHDDLLQKELADAMTIMIERVDEWDWPAEGLASRAELTPNKWRLFTDDDLPADCLLEILGQRWQIIIRQFLVIEQNARFRRVRQGAHGAPESGAEPLYQTAGLGLIGETDIWADARSEATLGGVKRDLSSWLEYTAMSGWSVFSQRRSVRSRLRDLNELSSYGDSGQRGGMETVVALVNAEVQVGRAAFPEAPLYVVKADLKDFYPTLPHDLILGLLEHYGLSKGQLAFFRRYLALPLQRDGDGGETIRARRGMPNERALSDLLGEMVLSALDWYVEQRARVCIIRLIDDICIVTPSALEAVSAWDAIQAFCATFGLAVNLEKCGSVCVGGERPEALPQGQPVWSLLTLDSQGNWNVVDDRFAAYLEQTRQRVGQQTAALAQIKTYNESLIYLLKALGVRLRLDGSLREQVNQALLRVHQDFFGPDQGIAPMLLERIRERFLEQGSATVLPEAWLYWPITAGGCGLLSAPILAASYARNYAQLGALIPPEERMEDWQNNQRWTEFYVLALADITPDAPERNQAMEALVSDFIARGSELSSGKQDKLSPYWRWALYIYGPQILESLGTFRYLITELVPLQLTTRAQGQDDDATADGDPPF